MFGCSSDEQLKLEVLGDEKREDFDDIKIDCNCFAEYHRDCHDCLFYKVCSAIDKLKILSITVD